MDSQDRDTLIRQAQSGDPAAFEALLEDCYEVIYRFAFRWSGGREAAQDITQQCCIKLVGAVSQYRFEAAFISWLYRLVINCAKDWYRRERRYVIDQSAGDDDGLDGGAELRVYLNQVLEYVHTLGEGFRETVLLVHSEGFSHKEAAQILEVKESTVSWRLHQIRKALASCDEGLNL